HQHDSVPGAAGGGGLGAGGGRGPGGVPARPLPPPDPAGPRSVRGTARPAPRSAAPRTAAPRTAAPRTAARRTRRRAAGREPARFLGSATGLSAATPSGLGPDRPVITTLRRVSQDPYR